MQIIKTKEKSYLINYDILFNFLHLKDNRSKKQIIKLVNIIINELIEHEKTTEIKFISDIGTTSLVWQIGTKILKIGVPRRDNTIPYHHRILQPLINQDILINNKSIHIEVTEQVETLNCNTIPQQVFLIIDEFEEAGLTIYDICVENFGILLKDNKIHFNQINFKTSNSVSSCIQYNNSNYILPSGELVLLDLDMLEITDIDKYVCYLKKIGFTEKEILKVYEKHNEKKVLKENVFVKKISSK